MPATGGPRTPAAGTISITTSRVSGSGAARGPRAGPLASKPRPVSTRRLRNQAGFQTRTGPKSSRETRSGRRMARRRSAACWASSRSWTERFGRWPAGSLRGHRVAVIAGHDLEAHPQCPGTGREACRRSRRRVLGRERGTPPPPVDGACWVCPSPCRRALRGRGRRRPRRPPSETRGVARPSRVMHPRSRACHAPGSKIATPADRGSAAARHARTSVGRLQPSLQAQAQLLGRVLSNLAPKLLSERVLGEKREVIER